MSIKVVYLEDCPDLRFLVSTLLSGGDGYDCLCLSSFDDLVDCAEDVLSSHIAILDVNLGLGLPTGIDAHKWLKDKGYQGKIAFLTGHARMHPHLKQADKLGFQVFEKPIKTDVLVKLVDKAASPAQI